MASSDATVTIHLQVTLNGKPIDHVINASAIIQEPESLRDRAKGLHLFLALDGEEFAKALTPLILEQITQTLRKSQIRG